MLSYSSMKSYFYNKNYSSSTDASINRILHRVETLIGEDNTELFYPKNLFIEEKCFELYLFCSNGKIIKMSEDDSEFITVNFFNMNNIEKVTLKEKYKNDYEKELEIIFKDKQVLKFNSMIDTNGHYSKSLAKLIENICKILLNK